MENLIFCEVKDSRKTWLVQIRRFWLDNYSGVRFNNLLNVKQYAAENIEPIKCKVKQDTKNL